MPDKIYIYGDSLLKATVPDGDFHYHFHINEVMQRYQTKLVEVVNRSKMGATIRKGALWKNKGRRPVAENIGIIVRCDLDFAVAPIQKQT